MQIGLKGTLCFVNKLIIVLTVIWGYKNTLINDRNGYK